MKQKKYLNASQYANLHGKSRERISLLISQGRIKFISPDGRTKLILENEPYPKDLRGRPKKIKKN